MGSTFSARGASGPQRHRPPDYTSRGARLRLFLWAAAIMLGLGAIDAARDGKLWDRLASFDRPAAEPFRNQLAEPQWRTANDPAGTFVAVKGTADDRPLPKANDSDEKASSNAAVELARREIRDDTAVFRPAEQAIWFHEVKRVAAPGLNSQRQAPRVTYLQLHNQPKAYRGEVVRVKGTVRSAYRTPAIENSLGIQEYVVYVIQPDGGPDSPILVYALAAPPGFPMAANGRPPAKPGLLREPVEVTGVFFKRCAYAATGGVFTAPVLIAAVPDWQPLPPRRLAHAPLSASQLGALSVAALLLAICVTAFLWKRTGKRREPSPGSDASGFVHVGSLKLGPTTAEQLQELERQARTEGQP